jgi:hypothetical protein
MPESKGWLAERILKAHDRDELEGAIVYNRQRVGKSSWSLQQMFDVYGNWDDVFRYTIYTLEDLIRALRDAAKKSVPSLLVDDAGVHLSKYMHAIDQLKVMLLQGLMDTVGISVSGIIFTCPTVNSVLKLIRDYDFYRVKIVKGRSPRWERVAIVHRKEEWMRREPGMRIAYEGFDVRLPDTQFIRYKKMRIGFLAGAMGRFKELFESSKVPRVKAMAEVIEDTVDALMTRAETIEPAGIPDDFVGAKRELSEGEALPPP